MTDSNLPNSETLDLGTNLRLLKKGRAGLYRTVNERKDSVSSLGGKNLSNRELQASPPSDLPKIVSAEDMNGS